MGAETRSITLQCGPKNVMVIYGNGVIVVDRPYLPCCEGDKVYFHFAGPPGTAAISPKDPNDEWLNVPQFSIPTTTDAPFVDTSGATTGVNHYYEITLTAGAAENVAVEISIDPIIRPE